jgi:dolichyl-phosphate-mannose-protein mannosyltransferase
MLQFGVGLNTPHPYQSQPWDWFVISRPVAFFSQTYTDPAGLHAETQANVVGLYLREVLAIGNPAIWWLSLPAMAVCLIWWAVRRDWRAGSALLCICAGWPAHSVRGLAVAHVVPRPVRPRSRLDLISR